SEGDGTRTRNHRIDSSVVQISSSQSPVPNHFAFQDLWHDAEQRSATNFLYFSAFWHGFKAIPCQIQCQSGRSAWVSDSGSAKDAALEDSSLAGDVMVDVASGVVKGSRGATSSVGLSVWDEIPLKIRDVAGAPDPATVVAVGVGFVGAHRHPSGMAVV